MARCTSLLLITSRGMTEVVSGWAGWPEMLGWLASRGSTGSGELHVPRAARRARCVQEEAVLAYALNYPPAIPAIASYLPMDTFTSDIRYDLWAAMVDLARAGVRGDRERVADALADRAAVIPARQLHRYGGGRGLPWAMALLWRLDWTLGERGAARAAAAALRAEDGQAAARQATAPVAARRGVLVGPRRAVRGCPARPMPVAVPDAGRLALPRPPVLPDGPVP